MNSDSESFQQKGRRKKKGSFVKIKYANQKPYKKFSGSKHYGSPMMPTGQGRPRFQSDEGYSQNDGVKYGDYYVTPPQVSAPYGLQDPGNQINQNYGSLSTGFQNQKKFRQGVTQTQTFKPHKLNYSEDATGYNQTHYSNYNTQFIPNQLFVQNN